ncbi:MAG: flagellar biosynthesis protein FlgA, partial [Pseudomonadota bacterium]|nr:flagellar biosynthesis protein FlgA [Pseudomonadota bacterium]
MSVARVIIYMLLAAGTAAASEPVQSLTALREQVRAFLLARHAGGDPAEVRVAGLDPRLRLAACAGA